MYFKTKQRAKGKRSSMCTQENLWHPLNKVTVTLAMARRASVTRLKAKRMNLWWYYQKNSFYYLSTVRYNGGFVVVVGTVLVISINASDK